MKYTTLFFDLDNTLWDFSGNSAEGLTDVFAKYQLNNYCKLEDFVRIYRKHNEKAWELFKLNLISADEVKINRFALTFGELGFSLDEETCKIIGYDYLELLSSKTKTIANAKEVLDRLSKCFKLHILSNGFHDVQIKKLTNSGLIGYFDKIITSEAAGSKKPDALIFEYALKITNTPKEEAIYIGDEFETDVIGAFNADLDAVWFNPRNLENVADIEPTFVVRDLGKLLEIFNI